MSSPAYRLEPDPKYGFLRIMPTPSAEEIARYYANEFYSTNYPRLNDSSLEVQIADKPYLDLTRQALAEHIVRLSGRPLSGQKILDIGCGWGQALVYFQQSGAQCYGFDPAPEAVEYARHLGLNVVQSNMAAMAVFPEHQFDVVTLLNVLEHLSDPEASLKEIHQHVIADDGLLVIDVPNEFNDFQLCAQKTHGLDQWWVAPPAHLNYFSNTTLRSLLAGVGFELLYLEASFPIELFLLFGEQYVGNAELGRKCHERRMNFEMNMTQHGYGCKLRELYANLAELGLGRQMIAYARPMKKERL